MTNDKIKQVVQNSLREELVQSFLKDIQKTYYEAIKKNQHLDKVEYKKEIRNKLIQIISSEANIKTYLDKKKDMLDPAILTIATAILPKPNVTAQQPKDTKNIKNPENSSLSHDERNRYVSTRISTNSAASTKQANMKNPESYWVPPKEQNKFISIETYKNSVSSTKPGNYKNFESNYSSSYNKSVSNETSKKSEMFTKQAYNKSLNTSSSLPNEQNNMSKSNEISKNSTMSTKQANNKVLESSSSSPNDQNKYVSNETSKNPALLNNPSNIKNFAQSKSNNINVININAKLAAINKIIKNDYKKIGRKSSVSSTGSKVSTKSVTSTKGSYVSTTSLNKYKNNMTCLSSNCSTSSLYKARNYVASLNMRQQSSANLSIDPNALQPAHVNQFRKLKIFVDNAIKNRKTFATYGHPAVRVALMKRGWVEKIHTGHTVPEIFRAAANMQIHQLLQMSEDKTNGYVYNRILKSKLIGTNPVDFIWDASSHTISTRNNGRGVLVNHFLRRGEWDFTSKIGMLRYLRQLKWYYQPNIADVKYPRSYVLCDGEWDEFLDDFRITACLGMLKWFLEASENKKALISERGTIPISAFNFALLQCIGFVKKCKEISFEMSYSVQMWSVFLDHFYKTVYLGEHFYPNGTDNVQSMIQQAKNMLARATQYRSDVESDGILNIWILKPAGYSRGNGIHICRRISQIRELMEANKHLRYVVQKYIERPLIIYNTKFDIRQWFLISRAVPLTVWMYKECYLRFSSQNFDLKRFHESVHLTNNSVQCRYKNAGTRHSALPTENMWHSNEFKDYLKKMEYPDAWDKIIYPKMKEAVMAVLLPAQDNMDHGKNAFELYGADFMITPDFQPWLIEINSHPALTHSTKITSEMCPAVIEDVMKVIIDRERNNTNSPTGKFELMYKENLEKRPSMPKEGFFLYGETIEKPSNDYLPLTKSQKEILFYVRCLTETIEPESSPEQMQIRKELEAFLRKSNNVIPENLLWKLQASSVCNVKSNANVETQSRIPNTRSGFTQTKNEGENDVVRIEVDNKRHPITDDLSDPISKTCKVVKMQATLKSLLEFLEQETNKHQQSSEPYTKKSLEDITCAVHHIQNAIRSVSGNHTNNNMATSTSSLHGVQKVVLRPKTLQKIINIITLGLYKNKKRT